MRLSQLTKYSKLSVNRTLANTFGPTDIYLSSYTLFANVPIGTEIARISSKDINSFSFVYTLDDISLFYIQGDKLYTNTVFTDIFNFDGHSVRITTDDGTYHFSKTFFIPFQKPPVVATIVNPLIINFGETSSQINLSNTFFDINGDAITITAISDNPTLVSTSVNGYMLTITYSNNSGSSVITLNAYDSYNEFAVTTFSIVVLPNNADYNVTVNDLPPSLPEPVDIIIDGDLTSFTQLDNTHINILIDEPDKATEEEKRDNVKSNISSIINKYVTTSQDNIAVDLYIPIDVLPFPQLASNIDKVRILDGSTSTVDNPLSVDITDNIENSATYVNTTPGNKVTVTLSSDTLTIEQVTKDIFNVSINGGAVETKNAGDFVVMPTSEAVISLSSIIVAENHAPIAYDINYTVKEDSIQNVIELHGYDVDINETSKNYIQYVIETAPLHGVLDISVNTDLMNKQIKYTPSEHYFGSDSFSYYVKDNYGVVSNTANTSITITNVDDPATGTLTMTGIVEEGGTLQYITDITDIEGGLTFVYQWQVSDDNSTWVNIVDANGTSYSIQDDQSLVDKYIRVTVTTTDSQGGITNIMSNSSQVSNVDDLATGILTITGTVEEGGDATYSYSINDVDGTITFISHQWQVSDDDSVWSNINGATEANYTIPSDQSLVDKYIRLTAVTEDSRGGTTNFNSNSSQVSNVDDAATGTLTITGTIAEGGTVSYSYSINDVDGTITFISHQWQVSDDDSIWSNINGATGASYNIPSDQSLVDKYIRLTAITEDSRGGKTNFNSNSSQVSNVDDPATGTLTITGTVEEGGAATYSYSINDVDGTITFISHQWQVSDDDSVWSNINGATEANYTIPSDQSLVDKYIRLTAVTEDSRGGTTNFNSNSSQVSNVDDLATGTLTITGTVEEGGAVSYSYSVNDVDGTITFISHQWQVSDEDSTWTNIDGATNATYTIPSDQSLVDKYIRLTAVTEDSRGGKTNFNSNSSQVSNVNDQPIGQLEIEGVVMESITISANTTNITDEDGILTYTYQWELSDDDSIWANIPSETNQTYVIPKDQGFVGKYVRVTTQSTDPNNNQTSHTSASSEIVVFNDPPTDIQLSGTEIYEGYEIGQEIGTLTSSDIDSTNFTYEIDSNLFSLNNNKLVSNRVFSYGSTNTYTINITTKDETLNEFTKSFVITVKRLWIYTTLSSTEVAIGNNTTDIANGTVLGKNLTGSIIIPSTIEDVTGNTYDVTNIYQNAFTGSSLDKITFSGDTTYTLDIPLKQVFQVLQTEDEYILHQLQEV